MVESTSGLVLRTRPLTETSLIVEWLTPGLGRLATAAKGARRPTSPFRGKLDLFYLADFSFVRSRRSELHSLREVSLRETYSPIRRELGYLRQASYAARLLELTTETDTPLPGLFELMTDLLNHLSAQPPQARTIIAFELKLVKELGLQPDLAKSRLNPGSKQLVRALSENDWPMLARLKLSPAQRGELKHFLQGFLLEHLGRVPPNREAALTFA
jgi:DNA repair protein RecO (recombination protein O)